MGRSTPTRLLAIGPLPPPLAGTSISFALFEDYINTNSTNLKLTVIDSAPKEVGERALFSSDKLRRACGILAKYIKHVRQSDSTVIFGNDQFLLTLMPLCLLISKVNNKPCFVRSFGGSLDQFYANLPSPIRSYFKFALGRCDGVIVQTQLLKSFFQQRLSVEITHVPGYRNTKESIDRSFAARENKADQLRLIYLGHVREEKGVFDLLESLRQLNESEGNAVSCDFYGQLYSEIEDKFPAELAATPNAEYRGELPHEKVFDTISSYDALVFPSYYPGEGHAGVIVEAMMAGLPIITTKFNALPELITHGDNGLLVSPREPEEIARAIRLLAGDADLRYKFGRRALESSKQYASDFVIPRLVQAIDLKI